MYNHQKSRTEKLHDGGYPTVLRRKPPHTAQNSRNAGHWRFAGGETVSRHPSIITSRDRS